MSINETRRLALTPPRLRAQRDGVDDPLAAMIADRRASRLCPWDAGHERARCVDDEWHEELELHTLTWWEFRVGPSARPWHVAATTLAEAERHAARHEDGYVEPRSGEFVRCPWNRAQKLVLWSGLVRPWRVSP